MSKGWRIVFMRLCSFCSADSIAHDSPFDTNFTILFYSMQKYLKKCPNDSTNPFKNEWKNKYCKVESSRLSRFIAHLRIFRLFMNGKFDAYLLWPLAKRVQNWIVDWSITNDFTLYNIDGIRRVEKIQSVDNIKLANVWFL